MQLQKNDCEQYGFQWIEQETFQDINNNGKYDPPEPLKDRNKKQRKFETSKNLKILVIKIPLNS